MSLLSTDYTDLHRCQTYAGVCGMVDTGAVFMAWGYVWAHVQHDEGKVYCLPIRGGKNMGKKEMRFALVF